MNRSTILFTIIISLLTLQACEECNDCGPEEAYPYFELTILNRTSLDTLQANVKRLKSELKVIENKLDTITNSTDRTVLNTTKKIKSDSLSYFNSIVTVVNRKLISISEINGLNGLYYSNLRDTDSLTSFRIPIDANNNTSTYAIKVVGRAKVDSLTVSYQLIDTTINDKITKAAKELKVVNRSYDSLRGPFGCPQPECISNLQTIYVEI